MLDALASDSGLVRPNTDNYFQCSSLNVPYFEVCTVYILIACSDFRQFFSFKIVLDDVDQGGLEMMMMV